MPILKDSAPVKYPAGNPVLVKYLDLTKLISLLQRGSLFFCRLDKLEDKFEGTTAKPNFQNRLKVEKHMRKVMRTMSNYDKVEKTDPDNDDSIRQSVKEYYDFENKLKSINCINCWNYDDHESAALWKIYSDFGKGIMLKSTLEQIENSFQNASEDIRVSEITYIDYSNDLMDDYNSIYPIIHKDLAYNYEKEVRFIHEIIPLAGWDHDWSNEEVEEGKYIKTDIDTLIDKIIIAPFAPTWYYDLIKDLCSKYELNKKLILVVKKQHKNLPELMKFLKY